MAWEQREVARERRREEVWEQREEVWERREEMWERREEAFEQRERREAEGRELEQRHRAASAPSAAASVPSVPSAAAPTPPPVAPTPPPVTPLQRRDAGGTGAAEYDTKVTAARFFLDCMEKGGVVEGLNLNSQRVSDARVVLGVFKAMATAAERELLLLQPPDRDEAHCQRTCKQLADLVKRRIAEEYRSHPTE